MNQPYNHSVIQFLTAYNRKLNYEIQKRLDLFQHFSVYRSVIYRCMPITSVKKLFIISLTLFHK